MKTDTMAIVSDSPLLTIPLSAFALTILMHLLALKFFPRWKLLDFPERYGLLRERLPYPTGILCVGIFLLIFPFIQPLSAQFLGVMIAVSLVGLMAFLDDRVPLPAWIRLIVQTGAAIIVFSSGDCTGSRICSVTNPLEGLMGGSILEFNGTIPILSLFITVFWLLLTMNALNWFDGIPGQVSTLSVIGFATIGSLSLSARVDQPQLALIAFVLAGISLGSMLFDFPPPTVVPGDSGAMFFGFLLGILTVYAGGKVATAFLVLGVPIIDLIFVIIRRITKGRSPLKGSMSGEHLHHRLLARGWKPRNILLLTAAIGSSFGITALFLNTQGKMIAAVLLAVLMLLFSLFADRPIRPVTNQA